MTDRSVLINLIAGLSLADHMGDVYEDCEQALKKIGIAVPSILESTRENPTHWEHLTDFLVKQYSATTIWGTALGEDNDR
jgi:hypothetical protein